MSSLWKNWVNITTPLPEFSWLTLFPRLTTWNPPLMALLVYLPILNTIPRPCFQIHSSLFDPSLEPCYYHGDYFNSFLDKDPIFLIQAASFDLL